MSSEIRIPEATKEWRDHKGGGSETRPSPRTGMADRLRRWMSARDGSFTAADISADLAVPPGPARQRIATILYDFARRGEILRETDKRNRRQNAGLRATHRQAQRWRYNHAWRKAVAMPVADILYKAMYVNGEFTMSQVRRQAGLKETGYCTRILNDLLQRGMIRVICRRRCDHGAGVERVYHIPDRDRFRIEVMK